MHLQRRFSPFERNFLTDFAELNLAEPILRALADEKYTTPTPIQEQAIPHAMQGRDILGLAQTGTGKTAAFALPILHRLAQSGERRTPKTCRALILSPTRELAGQIADSFRAYGRHLHLSIGVVFGGVSFRAQAEKLARGVDILVATPGRLIDHLDQRTLTLDKVEILVLDEADQMLDMGFVQAIRRISKVLPKERQSLFFSATMPRAIGQLAGELLSDPVEVSVTPAATTVKKIDQQVIFVETARKRQVLLDLLREQDPGRVLIFTRTKHGANRVAEHLEADGITSGAIHGNKSQGQRERALAGFRDGSVKVLVATDIAARGIDVEGVTHVINFELPNVAESYVHRIGRTARAGASGIAISLCDGEERPFLRSIEALIRERIASSDRRLPPGSPMPRPVPSERPAQPHAQVKRRPFRAPVVGDTGRSDAANGAAGKPRAHTSGQRPANARGPAPAGKVAPSSFAGAAKPARFNKRPKPASSL
jgi:ATP-dependent RNA helicase RhlE